MIEIKIFPDPKIEYDFESVYRPSDDTYLVVDYLKHHIDHDIFDGLPINQVKKILDMGTGTGFIALSLAIIKSVLPTFNPSIYASDILEDAINLSKKNAKLNDFEGKIEFVLSNLFESFPESLKNQFDMIIFNPPYLPSYKNLSVKTKIDHSWDGGAIGIEVFLKFLDQVNEFFNIDGPHRIYYVCSSKVDLDFFYQFIEEKGFQNKTLDKRHIFMEDIFLNRLEPI